MNDAPIYTLPDALTVGVYSALVPAPLPAPLPILYSFRRCPYAIRARLALAVSATPYALREVALRNKPAELLAASPKGTVPVLVLPSGEVIDESLNIMLWALERHDPLGWLGNGTSTGTVPSADPSAHLQSMLALIAECDGPFKQQLDAYKYPSRLQSAAIPDTAANTAANAQTLARQQASFFLDSLNQRLVHSACLWGAKLSLADMAIVPFVRQFAGVEPAWFAQTPWPALRGWLDGITASALFSNTMQQKVQLNNSTL